MQLSMLATRGVNMGVVVPPSVAWPGARNFTPFDLKITRFKGWYAAHLNDGLYSDDDPVGVIKDNSGQQKNIAASGDARPTFKTGILNGKSVVRFNGTANYLQSSTYVRVNPETVFIVMKANAGSSKLVACASRNYAARGSIYTHPATYDGLAASSGTILHNGNASIGDTWIYATVVIGAGGNGVVRVSGDECTGTIGTDKGGGIRIGAEGSDPAADFFDGDIAEILTYSGQLSTTEIELIEKYLKDKYQL